MAFFVQLGQDPYNSQAGQLGQALGQGLGVRFQRGQMQQQQGQLANALFGQNANQFSQLPLESQLELAKILQTKGKAQNEIKTNQQIISDLEQRRGLPPGSLSAYLNDPKMAEQVTRPEKPPKPTQASQPIDPDQLNKIQTVRSKPEYAKASPGMKYQMLTNEGVSRENARDEADIFAKEAENLTKAEERERTFHTNYSKKAVEEADTLRDILPRKEAALDYARDAIESKNVGALSLANLAKRTGIKELQTAKGKELELAAKEHLFSNIGRVSAKAQNLYMEQRLLSMLPEIGVKEEANLTAQEILEGEAAMDRVYLGEFDRLAKEDNEEYGYERKDIKKRASDAALPKQKEILKRTSYRIKELEEKEEGLKKLKEKVGKPVIPGTVMTLAMAKLYADEFGKEEALKIAKKNGYYVPSLEEFAMFQQRPKELRSGQGL